MAAKVMLLELDILPSSSVVSKFPSFDESESGDRLNEFLRFTNPIEFPKFGKASAEMSNNVIVRIPDNGKIYTFNII
jgi:hypothetical protein